MFPCSGNSKQQVLLVPGNVLSFSVCTIMEFLLEDTLPEAVVLSEISGDSLEISSSLQTEY
jgi:hypothetical protein